MTGEPVVAAWAEVDPSGPLTVSLATFCRAAWEATHHTPLQWAWFHDAICEHLEAVFYGQLRRLIINQPPRTLKSTIAAVFYPAWIWANDPTFPMIYGSYSKDLAERDSIACRDLVTHPWFTATFNPPGPQAWKLKDDRNLVDEYHTTAGGMRLSTSPGARGTGFGGRLVVVDDPIDVRQAHSDADRDRANRWVTKTLSTRFNDRRDTRMVVVQQRLHDSDTTGVLLRDGGWEHLVLPAEYAPRRWSYQTALGIYDHRHREGLAAGALLHADRDGEQEIADARRTLGADYPGQFGQDPVDPATSIFPRQYWRWWRHVDEPAAQPRPERCTEAPAREVPTFERIVISVDATFGGKSATSSYACIGAWGAARRDYYLLELVRARLSFVETVGAIISLVRRFPSAVILVEAKADGAAIIETLAAGGVAATPINPVTSKEVRAHAVSAIVGRGAVHLHAGAPWVEAFVDELERFPRAANDDQVDMTSQTLGWLDGQASGLDSLLAMGRALGA